MAFQIPLIHGMVRNLLASKWHLLETETMFTFKINFLGGKGVKKAITKIAKGTLKTEGKVWFTDLSDKGKQLQNQCNMIIFNEDF